MSGANMAGFSGFLNIFNQVATGSALLRGRRQVNLTHGVEMWLIGRPIADVTSVAPEPDAT